MANHHARLIATVVLGLAAFSTPVTAQQEPTPSPTLETLVETLGGRVRQNEQGEVEYVTLSGTRVTDAGLAHFTELTALKILQPGRTQITGPDPAHLSGLPLLETLNLANTQVTDAGVAELRKRLPNDVLSGRDPIPSSSTPSSMRGRRAPA